MDSFGFLKVAAAIPHLRVGDCDYNAERMAAMAEEAARRGVEIAAFPELGVTAYTCGDLVLQSTLLDAAGIAPDEIDRYVLHQGSRFIVKTIADRLRQPLAKFPIEIEHCGNTVSSTIPLIAERLIHDRSARNVVLSGFGVRLSWASCLCRRTDANDSQ